MEELTYRKGLELANQWIQKRNVYNHIEELLQERGWEVDEDTGARELYSYLLDYNWDDGFAFPYLVICHPHCELSTAIAAFWLAGGQDYFENREAFLSCGSPYRLEWKEFVSFLCAHILSGCYKMGEIPFPEEWRPTKTELFLRKKHGVGDTDIPDVFYGIGI